MTVLLVRHTRIAESAGLCYGHADVPLAASFLEEAADVSARLPWAPHLVLTSPATRCRKLAEHIASGAPLQNDIRLRELHMGDWEGCLWESFRGPESEAWARNPWNERPPRGEAAAELWARVADFRAEVQDAGHERLAVVTHAGVIRAWLGLASGRSLHDMIAVPVPFGSIHPVSIVCR